jgi:hypothetical protein
MKNPCWKGYKMIGTKKKDGKEVPNCVPEVEEDTTTAGVDMTPAKSKGIVRRKKFKDFKKEVMSQ